MKSNEIRDVYGNEFIAGIEMRGDMETRMAFKVEKVGQCFLRGRFKDMGKNLEEIWSKKTVLISIDDISIIVKEPTNDKT